jgi:hypothetical protein
VRLIERIKLTIHAQAENLSGNFERFAEGVRIYVAGNRESSGPKMGYATTAASSNLWGLHRYYSTQQGECSMRAIQVGFWLKPLRILTVGIYLTIPASLQAQTIDSCSAILSPELLTRRLKADSAEAAEAERYWACSASNTEIRTHLTRGSNTEAKDADGNVGFAGFEIKGKPSVLTADNSSDEAISKWKNESCKTDSRSQNLATAAYLAEQFLGPKVVEAWSDCVQKLDGLQCFAQKQGTGVNLTVSYRSFEITLPTIDQFEVFRGNSSPAKIEHAGVLFLGKRTYFIPREATADTTITLNAVKDKRINLPCSVFVPKDEPLQPAVTPAALTPQKAGPDLLSPLLNVEWCGPYTNYPIITEIHQLKKVNDKVTFSFTSFRQQSQEAAPRRTQISPTKTVEVAQLPDHFAENFLGLVSQSSSGEFLLQLLKPESNAALTLFYPGIKLGKQKPQQLSNEHIQLALTKDSVSLRACKLPAQTKD